MAASAPLPTPYQLKYPIELTFRPAGGGDDRVEPITEVRIRRVTGAEMLILDEAIGSQAKTQRMIAALTGLDELAVRRMDAVDLRAIDDIVEGFMAPGRPTGGTSSGT